MSTRDTLESLQRAMPSTAANPNESAYERGKFDGVMAYRRLIDAALRAHAQGASPALRAPEADAPTLSQWTDRDVLIGGRRFKAGSITISDVIDHAARASDEFYADDDELSEEDRHMVDRAWEKHKSAIPKSPEADAGEAVARKEPGPCPKCGCDSYIAGEPSWKHDDDWIAVAQITCDRCDNAWDAVLSLASASPAQADMRERTAIVVEQGSAGLWYVTGLPGLLVTGVNKAEALAQVGQALLDMQEARALPAALFATDRGPAA